jgi:BlaI family transcriptional regulator, penicillinase repressor
LARRASAHPTEAELEILKIVWATGPCTVRRVHDELNRKKPRAYTSIMTIMTIMARKGQLRRKKTPDGYLYSAKISEQETGRGMLRDLIDRVFGGSHSAAMLQLLDTDDIDEIELRKIRALLKNKK